MAKEFSDLPTVPGWGIYDWQQILGASTKREDLGIPLTDPVTVTLGMVYKVHAMHSSDNGEREFEYLNTDYVALIELQDGRWATVHAGNDTTGWGCNDYVDWRIFRTKEEAIGQGLTEESRRKLNQGLAQVAAQSLKELHDDALLQVRANGGLK